MKRTTTLAFLLLATATIASAELRGTWTASPREHDADALHVSFMRPGSQNSMAMPIAAFTGLTRAQIDAATQTPVTFELRREAGTLSFEGVFRNREGAGHFGFRPNSGYYDAIRSLGVAIEPEKHRKSEEERLLHLAVHDVSVPYIRSMIAEGYRVSLDDYLSMRIFRVTPQLVTELRELGFRNIAADDLVSSQVHKVTPAYIREMRAAGYTGMSLDELVSSRVHKATPEFAKTMRDLGYNLGMDDLVSFRIHRVTPEFIRELADLGYKNIPADKLVSMRIHKVTPEFIRQLRDAGYTGVPVDKMISMRIHGIDATFVKKMNGDRR